MNRKKNLLMQSIIASMFLFAAHDTLTHGGGSHGGGGHGHGRGGYGYGAGAGVGVGVGLGYGLGYDGYDDYDGYDGDYEGPVLEEEIVEEGGYRGRHDGHRR